MSEEPIAHVVISHLAPSPYAVAVAEALLEVNALECFATTFVEDRKSMWQRGLARVAGWSMLGRRGAPTLPMDRIASRPAWELIRLAVGKVDSDRRLTDWIFHAGLYDFDRWVARVHVPRGDAFYGFEYGCLESLRAAKKLGKFAVLDVPSPENGFVQGILEDELGMYKELETPYTRRCRKLQPEREKRRRDEFDAADMVVAASEFTRASFANAGVSLDKIIVVPYGAPPPAAEGARGGTRGEGPMRLIWAGTFGLRKGAHYLIDAWRKLAPDPRRMVLEVYGSVTLPPVLWENMPVGITFKGAVGRDQLVKAYRQSDLLVFPTLCDGFGMVVTEGLANGLPVLTTDRAGAAPLIRHKQTGLMVKAGDSQDLVNGLIWAMEHRQAIARMRAECVATAAAWQWTDYRRAIRQAVLQRRAPKLPAIFQSGGGRK